VTLIFGAEINAVLRDRHGRDGRLRLRDAAEPPSTSWCKAGDDSPHGRSDIP
jgi:hypothetical protein